MKYILSIFIFLHAAIHLMGFAKGFNLAQISALNSDISKFAALFWLLSFLLFLSSIILYITNNQYFIYFIISAVILSSILIIGNWSDAKFGMIANIIIIIFAAISFSSCKMSKMIESEKVEILSKAENQSSKIITEKDAENLPIPVKNWFLKSGIIGKEEIKSAYILQKAKMKMKEDQENWYNAEAKQYSTTEVPAFIWTVKLKMNPIIKIKGRDKFVNGKGEMLIKMNSLFTIVNEKGEKMDEGTMQRFLGELVWYPSFAISKYIEWESIDSNSAKATMTYNGTVGSGIFHFDDDGKFVKFVANRFKGNEEDAKRYPWILTVDEYKTFEGIKVPSKMKASWQLENGKWTWLDLEITEIRYNIGLGNIDR